MPARRVNPQPSGGGSGKRKDALHDFSVARVSIEHEDEVRGELRTPPPPDQIDRGTIGR